MTIAPLTMIIAPVTSFLFSILYSNGIWVQAGDIITTISMVLFGIGYARTFFFIVKNSEPQAGYQLTVWSISIFVWILIIVGTYNVIG